MDLGLGISSYRHSRAVRDSRTSACTCVMQSLFFYTDLSTGLSGHPPGKIHFVPVVLRNRRGIKFWLLGARKYSLAGEIDLIRWSYDCHLVLTMEKYIPIFDKLEERRVINKYFGRHFTAAKGTYQYDVF